MNNLPKSAYVHIPFCHRRCFYCDFSVIPIGDKVKSSNGLENKIINDYLCILKKEILSIKHKVSLSTIYIGGGTPSILNPLQIAELIKIFEINFGIDSGAEITMEIDPASFDETDLYGFIKAGVNRFSLGAQSFNNQILKQAGRRHKSNDVKKSCNWLSKAKEGNYIRTWSLDLIQNLPQSETNKWRLDLENALNFNPPHISIYDLIVEEGTVFKKLQDSGLLHLPNDDQSFKNSELTNMILKRSGYTRYEISNYSIPGHQSRHNRVYWNGLGWWSFGQGSTSSPWGIKFTRPRNQKEYKEWVINQSEDKLDQSLVNTSYRDLDLDEKIMMGMRLKEGINIKKLFKNYGWDEQTSQMNFAKLINIWEKYIAMGLVCNEGDRYYLSDPKGMELSNQILISMFQWWETIN
ncbi:MAG: radical SAM protein [Prochlorococcus sp. SP3034]|nr:radical SAM protein [Prochlorococcus sp. SP3034]|tara:strand:+ start:1296 stop:2519 length:1224 start_codon:yes stop_codon:yes gene_type:complete